MKALWRVAVVVTALGMGSAASAATFSGTWGLTQFNKSDPGLILATNKTSGSFSTNLNVGQSFVFPLFQVWTSEKEVNGDDKAKKLIRVSLTLPALSASGVFVGDTYGVTFGGIAQAGKVTWRASPLLSFGPGGSGKLAVALTDRVFNEGFFGLDEGKGEAATVKAKITYKSAPNSATSSNLLASTASVPAPVPLPAAGLLLLGALGGLGLFSRRRA